MSQVKCLDQRLRSERQPQFSDNVLDYWFLVRLSILNAFLCFYIRLMYLTG